MEFANTYADTRYAEAYSRLEFPGTYHLAYRDLPAILAAHVHGRQAVDFGCGSGRSTRFLRRLGFAATGIDISEEMIRLARRADPEGDYRLVPEDDFSSLPKGGCDLVLSVFTFDNIPTRPTKVAIFSGLAEMLAPGGRIVSVVSSPEIYLHEWVSFSTRDFVEQNRRAKSGDVVRIINTAIADSRPVEDILWSEEAYREVYAAAGLEAAAVYKPLGREDEGIAWVNETRIAPWTVYVLRRD